MKGFEKLFKTKKIKQRMRPTQEAEETLVQIMYGDDYDRITWHPDKAATIINHQMKDDDIHEEKMDALYQEQLRLLDQTKRLGQLFKDKRDQHKSLVEAMSDKLRQRTREIQDIENIKY